MNNIEELKKAALGANLHGWTGFEDALNDDGYSEAVSKFIGHCRPSEILALIAQLEAAKKLAQHYLDQRNAAEQVSAAALRDWAKEGQRAETAEAALSAANEKLKGEQVPVAWTDAEELRGMAKDGCGYLFKVDPANPFTDPRRQIMLFTAPQKPVVLSSSTVMSRAYVVQAIEAAGFKVEGSDG